MGKIAERKYLAHYIDINPLGDPETAVFNRTDYIRAGKDLEELTEELSPDVAVQRNILGENNTVHSGFKPESSTELRVRYKGGIPERFAEKLLYIAENRLKGKGAVTTKVDVLVNSKGEVLWAYRENAVVVPLTVGGDRSGIIVGYSVRSDGARTSGVWDIDSKTFIVYEPTANTDYIYDESRVILYIGKSQSPEIPQNIGGFRVREIGMTAFRDSGIEAAHIPDGVQTIE